MSKVKWLIGEVDKWEGSGIITKDAAENIKSLYKTGQNYNAAVLVFSIIGALLVGCGIILIFAKNWYEIPVFVRTCLSFLPLVLSQALAVFAFVKRSGSKPWREGTAVFMCLSVFANIALIGQIFHVPGDFGRYMLACGLLILPAVYVLDASTAAAVYCYSIVNWAWLYSGEKYTVWLLCLLFLLVLPFVIYHVREEKQSPRGQFLAWVAVATGFQSAFIAGIASEKIVPALLIFFAFLHCIDLLVYSDTGNPALRPFKICSGVGIFTMLFILSYSGVWNEVSGNFWGDKYFNYLGESALSLVLAGIALAACVVLFIKSKARDPQSILRFAAPAVFSFVLIYLPFVPLGFILVNTVLLAEGVLYVVRGAKEYSLFETNLGMAIACLLIVLRFFDWRIDFLIRGIAFLVLGIAFLAVNLIIARKRGAVGEK